MIILHFNNTELPIEVDDNSYRHRAIMGDNSITLYFSLAEHIEIPVGAYCDFENERYTLMRPERLKKKHGRYFEYTVIMEAAEAKAKFWKFRNPVDGRLKFSYTARPHEHLQMFVDNMNRRDSGWQIGGCIEGVEIPINYDHVFCYEALSLMASEFNTEFEIIGKTVSLHKVQYNKDSPIALSYGRGKGFKSGLGRDNSGDRPPVEILFIQGGERNINASEYGSSTLLLPKEQTIAYDGEHFEDEDGFNAEYARTYLTDDMGLSVRRSDKALTSWVEDSLDCSDIYPRRVGTVSGVTIVDAANNFFDIIDDSIPADLNFEECLIAGETMCIRFQSGMLAGKEFDVRYVHAAKNGKEARRFEIVPQEIDGQKMPNATFAPVVGNTYAVFGCMLPDGYIRDDESKTGASWDMLRAAVRYLYENEDMRFSFTGTLDGIWARRDWANVGGKIKLGAYISFSDEHFHQEGSLVRITGIKDYINNPHSPEVTLSNATVSGGFSATMAELRGEEVTVEDRHREAVSYTKRRFRDAQEAMEMLAAAFSGYTDGISPIAVHTMQLLAGDESLQFRFVTGKTHPSPVTHEVTYNAATKTLTAPEGIIQHLTLGIGSLSPGHADSEYRFWNVSSLDSAALTDSAKRYYLYARVSKTAETGTFTLSETPIEMEYESGFYHLLVGILGAETGGERSFVTLYGFTEVLPGRITTDRIVSGDGDSYFDLTGNAVKLGDVLDFNSLGDGKLRLSGAVVQGQSGAESVIGCFRGEYNASYIYYNGDEVTFSVDGVTSTYRMIHPWGVVGKPPTQPTYWTVIASGGQPGSAGNYTETRYGISTSATAAPQMPPNRYTRDISVWGWYTTRPAAQEGRFIWKTTAVIDGSDGSVWDGWQDPWLDTALKGADGDDGKDGADGDDGKTPYISGGYWYIGNNNTGVLAEGQDGEDGSTPYIGTNGNWHIGPTDTGVPAEGKDGTDGEDGNTPEIGPNGNWWIGGVDTGVTARGASGNGISGVTEMYAASASGTAAPGESQFRESIPPDYGPSSPYLWNYEIIHNTIDDDFSTVPAVIGVYGRDGASISQVMEYYARSGSKTAAPPKSSFGTGFVEPTREYPYIWNYERIEFSDGTSTETAPAIIGAIGPAGEDGRNGDYTEIRYAVNGSRTSPPYLAAASRNPPGWSTVQPPVGELQYLWLISALIDGVTGGLKQDTSWSTPVRITPHDGENGQPGARGRDVIAASTDTRQFTEAQWNIYGAKGHSEAWTGITNYQEYSAGDTIVIPGVCTDRDNAGVSLHATVTAVSGTTVTATSRTLIMGGRTGAPGTVGGRGVSPVYRGVWASGKTYTGNPLRCDVVLHGGEYWIAAVDKGEFQGQTPGASSSYWNSFGGSFESVATDLLLAQWANIAGFIFKTVDGVDKMWSQWGTANGQQTNNPGAVGFIPNIEMDGVSGYIKTGTGVYLKKEGLELSDGAALTLVRNQSLTSIISSLSQGGDSGTVTIPTYETSHYDLGLTAGGDYSVIVDTDINWTHGGTVTVNGRSSPQIDIEIFLRVDLVIERVSTLAVINTYNLIDMRNTVYVEFDDDVSPTGVTISRNTSGSDRIRSNQDFSVPAGCRAVFSVTKGSGQSGVCSSYVCNDGQYSIARQAEWNIQGRRWTLVGNDGIYVARGGSSFRVENSGDGLTVAVKGLPGIPSPTPGELYVDRDGCLKVS